MGASAAETAQAIQSMRIRGAAAIGRAAANALAHEVAGRAGSLEELRRAAHAAARILLETRPTAVPLRHGLHCVMSAVGRAATAEEAKASAARAARAFEDATAQSARDIARHGAAMVRDGDRILTHCHSSTVAAVLAEAWRTGKRFEVWATETRPFRQGLLTVRALSDAGVPATLIVDSAVRRTFLEHRVDHVLVGADTVSREGHLFNKVGTSGVAALAGTLRIPFRCAAGFCKFSEQPASGIRIEERAAAEIASPAELAPLARVENPVFDRTDSEAVAAYITEDGARPPAEAVSAALNRLRGLAA